jgi:long-chain fatty acid transport protein
MKLLNIALLGIAAGASLPVLATDGYFASGYGITAKGMGGVAAAMSKDAFGGANNPASMVWVGNRADVGVEWFSPQRKASRSGSLAGLDGEAKSDSTNFYIPEFGYNHMLNDHTSLGVTVYGNGGMNTNYPGGQIARGNPVCGGFSYPSPGPYNLLCGSGRLNMDLAQVIVAPTLAYKLSEKHSIGISPLLAYQRFKIDGLSSFQFFTPSMTSRKLSNAGYDSSRGFGVRVGWMGKINEALTLGAAYSTKLKMSNFHKYQELYAEQGGFDIPENYSLGAAFKASPALTLAMDYQRINYGGIKSINNSGANASAFPGGGGLPPGSVGSLGCNDCRGFGWRSVNVYKFGVEYAYSPALTLRGGYNHTGNPVQSSEMTFNIIAPGVVKDHVTLGFTYAVAKDQALTMAYGHAFKNSVSGPSLFNSFGIPAGTEKVEMHQNLAGIAYSWKL